MRYSLILILAIITITSCKEKTPSKDNTTEGKTEIDENAINTVEGTIYDLTPIYIEEGGLSIFLEDKEGNGVNLDFYRAMNPEKFDAFPEDFEVDIIADYKVKLQQKALNIQSLDKKGGQSAKDFEDKTVYEAQGTQTKVEENNGLMVFIETTDGTTLELLTDADTYKDGEPASYNGKEVKVIYADEEQWILQDYRLTSTDSTIVE